MEFRGAFQDSDARMILELLLCQNTWNTVLALTRGSPMCEENTTRGFVFRGQSRALSEGALMDRVDDDHSQPHGAFVGKTPYEVLRAKLC